MKKVLALVLVLCISLLAGCNQAAKSEESKNTRDEAIDLNAQTVIRVVAPKSPATIPVLRMIENNCLGDDTQIDLQLYNDMEAMMALASDDEYRILIVPAHTAANLYNKGLDVKVLNVFNQGGMYLSTTDSNCNSWKDLKGKELYVPSKGSIPDILTQYYLSQNGLAIGEDVDVVYSSHIEIAQLIASGATRYAIDAQPFVSSNEKNVKGYKVISDFSEEWKLTQGEQYTLPANCTVINSKYLSENKELITSFREELGNAVKWTLENPSEAGTLASTYLKADAELIAEAMQGFCFKYKSADDAKKDMEQYYSVLLEIKPEIIGNKIPEKNFYY